jgi:hypothetical protein
MFLDLLESAGPSDCGALCTAYAEPAYTRRCVTDECSRVYTAHVYAGHSGVYEILSDLSELSNKPKNINNRPVLKLI